MKHLSPILAATLLAIPAYAQDSTPTPTPIPSPAPESMGPDEEVITITATRNPELVQNTASTVTVITREELETKQVFNLSDALRLTPGVAVVQSGTIGKTSSIFTRGTESRHTLVLLDGVRVNNPDDGRFDPSQFPIENIERIEVVRGPQSALYGSDAIGGVINIISRKGSGPLQPGGKFEYGSFDTNRQVASLRGAIGKTRLSLTAQRLASDGTFRNDDFTGIGTNFRLDHALSEHQNLSFIGRLNTSKFGVPGQRFNSPDPFQAERTRDVIFSLQWENRQGKRYDRIIAGTSNRYLKDNDLRDPSFPSIFEAKNHVHTVEAQTAYDFGEHTLTAGIEQRRETVRGSFAAKTDTRGIFIQDEFRAGKLTIIPGYRREDNSQFGGFNSYRLASAYQVAPKTRLKATYGTAFKAPSFIFLYYPGFSNPNLEPERSKGMEFGVEHRFGRDSVVEATLFRNRITDLIDGGQLANINNVRTQGIELAVSAPINRRWRARLNQTFTDIESSSAIPPTRRPDFNTNADLIGRYGKWTYDLGVLAQGERYDRVGFLDPITKFGGYTRWDLAVGYDVRPGLQVYARAQNLFNKQYTEVAGFPAQGFNLVFGLKSLAF